MPPVSRGKPPSHKMSKTALREHLTASKKRKATLDIDPRRPEPDTQLVFDDPYGDDYESETDPDTPTTTLDDPMTANEAVVFRPGKDKVAEGEKLVCDESAYHIMHKCTVEWPSMSFDYVCVGLDGGYNNLQPLMQQTYPLSVSFVMGTQADRPNRNKLVCVRISNLHRSRASKKAKPLSIAKQDSDDDSSSDEEDEEDDMDSDPFIPNTPHRDPLLQTAEIKFDSVVNRIRCMPQQANIVAVWSESQRVSLVDTKPALDSIHLDSAHRMNAPNTTPLSKIKPLYSYNNHFDEGFALDWSRVTPGRLLSGACNGTIFLCQPTSNGAGWQTQPSKFCGHKGSVEDIQWSPNERDVFASCASDHSIRIWDAREHRRSVLNIFNAHEADVNVISWNRAETHLIVSGGDEGGIKVWDMRCLDRGDNQGLNAAAHFTLHEKPITCVQWHPTDSSMLLAGSEDGCVSIWDLAVERDAEEELREGVVVRGAEEFPPQLLFMHMGQRDVKEAQWFPASSSVVVSTAADGVNLFQAANIVLPT